MEKFKPILSLSVPLFWGLVGLVASKSADNPCENRNFRSPIYSISNFKYRKNAQSKGAANFTLTDIANNYSIECGNAELSGDINFFTPDDTLWYHCCVDHTLSSPDKGSIASGYQFGYGSNRLRFTQEWACPKPSGLYPWTYLAFAEWSFTTPLNCTNNTDALNMNGFANCTLSSDEKVNPTRTASWVPATPDATTVPIQPLNASISVTEESLNSSCVRRSFTYPGWWVEVLSAETVQLRNMATNYTVTCRSSSLADEFACESGESATLGLSRLPETQVRRRITGELLIRQSWACAGVKPEFNSSGSVTIPSNCAACHAFEVRGTLSEPVELRPNRPPPPKGIKTPGCTSASANPAWTLSNIRQRQEKWMIISAFVNLLNRKGVLDFDLYNHANRLTVHCHVEGEELTNYTGLPFYPDTIRYDKWFDCDANASDPHQFPKYNVSTAVQFDKRNGFLHLNHTWFCSDEGDDRPVSFAAQASVVSIPFQCNDTSPRSSQGYPQFQTEECFVADTLTLPVVANLTKTPLAPGELSNPDPTLRSCTASSVLSAAWHLKGLESRTDWEVGWLPSIGGLNTMLSVTILNAGFGRPLVGYANGREVTPYALNATSHVMGEEARWYSCGGGTIDTDGYYVLGPNPVGHVSCEFGLDLTTGWVGVRQSWVCDDKDADHPIVFEAVGTAYLDLKCGVEHGWLFDSIRCRWPEPKPIVPTSLSWRTVTKGVE